MSRSGYLDDCEEAWRWDGIITRTLNGKRSQKFLRGLLDALDAMPNKELHTEILVEDGKCCAMGAYCLANNIDVTNLDPDDSEKVAKTLGISESLAREIAYLNDEYMSNDPAKKWQGMRDWVVEHIQTEERKHVSRF